MYKRCFGHASNPAQLMFSNFTSFFIGKVRSSGRGSEPAPKKRKMDSGR